MGADERIGSFILDRWLVRVTSEMSVQGKGVIQ